MKKQTFYKNNILQDCSTMKKNLFIIFKRKNFYTVNEIHGTKIEQSFREQRKKKNKKKEEEEEKGKKKKRHKK